MNGTISILLTNAAVAGLLALVLLLFVGRLRKRPALLRGLCLLILLKLVTPPLMTFSVPSPFEQQPEPVVQTAVLFDEPGDERLRSAGTRNETASIPASIDDAAVEPRTRPLWIERVLRSSIAVLSGLPWATIASLVWLAGTLTYFILITTRYVRFRRLLETARPATGQLAEDGRRMARRLGLARMPSIVTVAGRVSPLLWTLSRDPKVVLPAALLERLDREARLSLMAHEMAHLRRRDHWVRLLEALATGLYWWNPAVWWVRRQLQDAEEQCCDAWVIWAMPAGAHTYASSLVTTMDFLSQTRFALPPAASGAGHFESLKRRLTMIMTGTTARSISPAGRIAVLVAALAVLPFLPSVADAPEPTPAPEAEPAVVADVAPPAEPAPRIRPVVAPLAGSPAVRPAPVVALVPGPPVVQPEPMIAPVAEAPVVRPEPMIAPVAASPMAPPEPASMPLPVSAPEPMVRPTPATAPEPDSRPMRLTRPEPAPVPRPEPPAPPRPAASAEPNERMVSTPRATSVRPAVATLPAPSPLATIRDDRPVALVPRASSAAPRVIATVPAVAQSSRRSKPASAAQFRHEIELELGDGIAQYIEDYNHELRSIRKDIRNAILQESIEVQAGLSRIDFNEIVEQIVRDAPESLQLFAREIDVDHVVRETLRKIDVADREVTDVELRRLSRDAERELKQALDDLGRDVQDELEEIRGSIRQAVRRSSADQLKVISEIDFADLMDELTRDVPEPVRQFVSEVDVPSIVADTLASGAI